MIPDQIHKLRSVAANYVAGLGIGHIPLLLARDMVTLEVAANHLRGVIIGSRTIVALQGVRCGCFRDTVEVTEPAHTALVKLLKAIREAK